MADMLAEKMDHMWVACLVAKSVLRMAVVLVWLMVNLLAVLKVHLLAELSVDLRVDYKAEK
jgi:hypothetical protein